MCQDLPSASLLPLPWDAPGVRTDVTIECTGHAVTLEHQLLITDMCRKCRITEHCAYLQVCGLSAIYCCYTVSNEPVSTQIPSQWPPYSIPVPAGLDKASLDCASGNCTDNALGPAAPPPMLPEGRQAARMHARQSQLVA